MMMFWCCVAFLVIWSLCFSLSIELSSATSIQTEGQQVHQIKLGPNGVIEVQEEDPIIKFQFIPPRDGDVETLPVVFRMSIDVNNFKRFKDQYDDKVLCVELNQKWQSCGSVRNSRIGFDDLPTGSYTARAFITDERGAFRYHETPSITILIVTKEEFDTYSAAMLEAYGNNLLEWAAHRRALEHLWLANTGATPSGVNTNNTLLVVGVKTAVVGNFQFRQAIRQTWASPDVLLHDVKVFFVGCVPDLSNVRSSQERHRIQKAIDLEKQTYGDLLTDELSCEDSYPDLPNKVKEFLRFTTQTFPQTPFVMVTDDDIYLRADRLVDELRRGDRSQRMYIGQVWGTLFGRSQTPVRETTGRYYIPEDRYPLHTYPPFAFGPHYLLSMDCARFIAKNSDKLRGFGAMDDVSVALWLLLMQVHVNHTPAFSSLEIESCKNKLLSLADLSPFGIRSIHTNIDEKRDFCYGFDEFTWRKSKNASDIDTLSLQSSSTPLVEIQTYVHDLEDTEYLFVTSIISTEHNAGVKVSYYPSSETFRSYSRRVCLEARTLLQHSALKSWMCGGITLNLRDQVQKQFQIVERKGSIDHAFLELWRYNLFVSDEDALPFIVAYTTESSYASVVFECIFKTIFENHKRPILVIPEETLRVGYGNKADVFIFSIFDADCDPMSNPGCPEMIEYYMNQYLFPVGQDKTSKLMMISGEAIDTQGLDDRVPLLSSVSSVSRKWHVYLPVASISFAERLQHTPMKLLSPASTSPSDPEERQFCAYLYARCDRPYREYMFDLLNAMEPVDALGICAGSSRPPDKSYRTSRYSKWFNDEAVISYQRYKFVVAFENSALPGYVTEKLVNPLLAGSIPIYLGNSATASQLFNPDSYIDCGRFEKLEDCAAFVLKVHKSPKLYDEMRREAPIRNITMFNEVFSWHPSVPSRALAENVAKMLQLDR